MILFYMIKLQITRANYTFCYKNEHFFKEVSNVVKHDSKKEKKPLRDFTHTMALCCY